MLYKFSRNLGWAVRGIIYAVRTEPHMRFHLSSTVVVILAGWWLDISAIQWLFVIFAIALVWVAELINTAIEAAVDLYTSDYHPLAKVAKDVAAGAVLVAAVNSLMVAGIIFLPKLIAKI